MLSKYFKDEWQTRKVTQHDLMVNVRGTLFNGMSDAARKPEDRARVEAQQSERGRAAARSL